eukprot:TRINITY_DN28362_c0_g1_i1.p2 TRINITY_DN28362_c0_g1~~TRINITY_DN28362_c0_g1_i1.p2  ORF type:complete len:136 (+),score=0.45 TRINITY_DN28362_c0_g1_i1:417-824(+)
MLISDGGEPVVNSSIFQILFGHFWIIQTKKVQEVGQVQEGLYGSIPGSVFSKIMGNQFQPAMSIPNYKEQSGLFQGIQLGIFKLFIYNLYICIIYFIALQKTRVKQVCTPNFIKKVKTILLTIIASMNFLATTIT